jgi:hypothetical protein
VNALAQGTPLADVVLVDELNDSLELLGAQSTGMDVSRDGQKIKATRQHMAPGESAQVVLSVRVRQETSLETIRNQASLRYAGLAEPIFSIVVEVKVVRTAAPTAAPEETPQLAATAVAAPAGKGADAPPQSEPADLGAQLPNTSGGSLPLSGILLLGLTLLIRSVRTHRARVRI